MSSHTCSMGETSEKAASQGSVHMLLSLLHVTCGQALSCWNKMPEKPAPVADYSQNNLGGIPLPRQASSNVHKGLSLFEHDVSPNQYAWCEIGMTLDNMGYQMAIALEASTPKHVLHSSINKSWIRLRTIPDVIC